MQRLEEASAWAARRAAGPSEMRWHGQTRQDQAQVNAGEVHSSSCSKQRMQGETATTRIGDGDVFFLLPPPDASARCRTRSHRRPWPTGARHVASLASPPPWPAEHVAGPRRPIRRPPQPAEPVRAGPRAPPRSPVPAPPPPARHHTRSGRHRHLAGAPLHHRISTAPSCSIAVPRRASPTPPPYPARASPRHARAPNSGDLASPPLLAAPYQIRRDPAGGPPPRPDSPVPGLPLPSSASPEHRGRRWDAPVPGSRATNGEGENDDEGVLVVLLLAAGGEEPWIDEDKELERGLGKIKQAEEGGGSRLAESRGSGGILREKVAALG
nr:basic proline-rich protein-like [Aegilops tauschii subsp. strangulata]